MAWGVRWYLVGSILVLGALAGCSGGGFFAEREPWRHEAEMQCLNSGTVREGAGIVRINSIRGPGMCGADFPLKVSILGESAALGYSDDPRPPATIPGGAAPRWPIAKPSDTEAPQPPSPPPPPSRSRVLPQYQPGQPDAPEQPISLDPPNIPARTGRDPYDFRRPYGAPPSPRYHAPSAAGSPRDDFSPELYDRRPLVDAPGVPRDPPGAVSRAPLRDMSAEAARGSARDVTEVSRRREPPPVVPLAPARDPRATGTVAPVAVNPPATLACPLVSELERWIAQTVQPAALRWFGSPVAEIKQISAYSCRGMNGNRNARISEHAFGNALDIAAFTLADGRKITVKGGWGGLPEEQGFLRDIQGAACEQFTTVLAPGSNVYHYDHIHVDLMRRQSGYRICNPHAVSGEEVAARAGARYAGRREPSFTGSTHHRLPPPPKRLKSEPDDEDRALPMAEPGDDGQDD